MSFDFTVSDVIPATPEAIYAAWLDSAGHTGYQDGGWQHNYFDPMKQYFAK
jgi:hypothetical protein